MKYQHGGKRKGAGAPVKSPELGARKAWSGRLPEATIAKLKKHATADLSQADIVALAVEAWIP